MKKRYYQPAINYVEITPQVAILAVSNFDPKDEVVSFQW